MQTVYIRTSDFANDTTDTDRHWRLKQLHYNARALGQDTRVIYDLSAPLDIRMPSNGGVIELTNYTDFNGAVINITSDCPTTRFIFRLTSAESEDWKFASKRAIDSRDFRQDDELSTGTKLLVIQDNTRWVYRYGYEEKENNKPKRKDILLVKNGIAQNRVVYPYSTRVATPQCLIYETNEEQKVFMNGTFTRSIPTNLFFLLDIGRQNNVLVDNISVTTVDNVGITGDMCFRIQDSTNITFNDVTINGSCSTATQFGYGILMDNVWNSTFNNLNVSNCLWGVFGNINVNTVTLNGGVLNRFDVHYYGADFICRDVVFENLASTNRYNSLTGFYGQALFERCTFKDFTPLLYDPSYQAYVEMDLILKDCILDWRGGGPERGAIVDAYGIFSDVFSTGLPNNENPRMELEKKCLPNMIMRNLTIYPPSSPFRLNLFHCGGSHLVPIDYLSVIDIKEITIIPTTRRVDLYDANVQFSTVNPVFVRQENECHEGGGGAVLTWTHNLLSPTSLMCTPIFRDEVVPDEDD